MRWTSFLKWLIFVVQAAPSRSAFTRNTFSCGGVASFAARFDIVRLRLDLLLQSAELRVHDGAELLQLVVVCLEREQLIGLLLALRDGS
jgi:hypothetical protein